MKILTSILNLLLLLVINACQRKESLHIQEGLEVNYNLLFEESFEKELDNWKVEQMPGGTVKNIEGKMVITDNKGCTVWFKKKLKAPLLIEYDVVVVKNGGPHDRVSDLNCFWLATDPNYPEDFFKMSEKRNGKFKNYDALQLYYVGLGGHHNTKTRFRRYEGNGIKPVLPEHDLSETHYLIEANKNNHIKIVVFENYIQYYRNEQLIYDFFDSNPYKEGYFGIRTVDNHMLVDNFKVFKLSK